MKKKNRSLVIIIVFILAIVGIVLGIKYSDYRIENGAVNFLAEKYGWEISEVKIIEFEKGHFEFSFGLDDPIYLDYKTPKWICEYQERKFNVEYTNFDYADDYQLEDIFNWCTEYLQENVDEEIVGVEVYSDIIYHSSEYKFAYKLPWNSRKVFTKDDAGRIIEIIRNHLKLAVFFQINDIANYGTINEMSIHKYYLPNENYWVFEESKQKAFGSNTIVVLISDICFSRDAYDIVLFNRQDKISADFNKKLNIIYSSD